MVWGNEDIESTVVGILALLLLCWAAMEAAGGGKNIHIEAGSGLATPCGPANHVQKTDNETNESAEEDQVSASIVAISALEYRAVESLRKKLHDYEEEEVDLIGNRAKKGVDSHEEGEKERKRGGKSESSTTRSTRAYLKVAAESEEIFLLRFLRARKFQVDKSWEMLRKHLEWRRIERIDAMSAQVGADVLGVPVERLWDHLPTWTQGFDRHGGPVIYKDWGSFNVSRALIELNIPVENLVRYHIWQNEQAAKLLGHQSIELGRPVTKFSCVFEAKGWHPGLASRIAMAFLKGIAIADQNHFPERLRCVVVVNAPAVIAFVWRVVSSWLDPVTRDKVRILAAPESNWRPVLNELIDDDNLPECFGGKAPVQKPTGAPVALPEPHLPPQLLLENHLPSDSRVQAVSSLDPSKHLELLPSRSKRKNKVKRSSASRRQLFSPGKLPSPRAIVAIAGRSMGLSKRKETLRHFPHPVAISAKEKEIASF